MDNLSLTRDFLANKAGYYAYLADSASRAAPPVLKFSSHASGVKWIQAAWLRSFYNQMLIPLTLNPGCGCRDALDALDEAENDLAHFGRPAIAFLPDGTDDLIRNAFVEKGFLKISETKNFVMALDLDGVDLSDLEAKIASLSRKADVRVIELIRPSPPDCPQPTPLDAMNALTRGFGFGSGVADHFSSTLGSAPCGPNLPLRNFVAVSNLDPTTTRAFITLFVDSASQSAAIYNLSAPREFRGGLGALLTLSCIRSAKQSGLKYVLLQPSPKAAKLYAKLGFVTICDRAEVWVYGSWKMGLLPCAVYWIAILVVSVRSIAGWFVDWFGMGGGAEKKRK